jgi:hypothetical protein
VYIYIFINHVSCHNCGPTTTTYAPHFTKPYVVD